MDINSKISELNAFWIASHNGHGEVMKELAEAGIDILWTNYRDNNALHIAVQMNHCSIVDMLLQSGYPVELENADGMNALMLAAYYGHNKILTNLIDHVNLTMSTNFKSQFVSKLNYM